jgi:hypothetical protein
MSTRLSSTKLIAVSAHNTACSYISIVGKQLPLASNMLRSSSSHSDSLDTSVSYAAGYKLLHCR